MMLFYDNILLSFFQNPYFKTLRQSATSLWDKPLPEHREPFIKPHQYLSGRGGGGEGGSKRKTRPNWVYNAQDGMILWDWDQKGRSKSMNS